MPSPAPAKALSRKSAGSRVIKVRPGPDPSYLERLGVLYAFPVRMKIATELYRREMSPTQWIEEFGGGSYGMIYHHFKRLEKTGWLRKVQTRNAAAGSGRYRDLYRATELAVVDDETWAELPTSIQVAFTARCLRLLGERIGGALARGSVDAFDQADRLFECGSSYLDDPGWDAAMAAMRDCFFSLTQEQLSAKVRLARSSEPGALMTTAMAGFESPGQNSRHSTSELAIGDEGRRPLQLSDDGDLPLATRMAKVFGDPVNLKVLKALHGPPRSPSQLHDEFGGASKQAFDRRCQGLTEMGWVVRLTPPSEPPPIFYTAAGPEAFDADLWGGIPEEAAKTESWSVFDSFCTKAEEALREGSFNARQDRHVTFCTFLLDARGRKEVSATLTRCKGRLDEIKTEAAERARREKRSRPSHKATFFFARFEDPEGDCDC